MKKFHKLFETTNEHKIGFDKIFLPMRERMQPKKKEKSYRLLKLERSIRNPYGKNN